MLAVDLFAGAGGSTTGATQAGARVLWAANHWPAAVEVHRQNHPATAHACQDLHQTNFYDVPDHDFLMASPACQGHSRAKGRERPEHDGMRSTAWAVVSCAEAKRPRVIVVENVPEFRRWTLYPAWKLALEALGYRLQERLINAADCGVPQSRLRLFVIGTRSRKPLLLPCPDEPHRPASEIIDWTAGQWSPIERPGRSPKTLARIRQGRREFGDRFLIAFYGNEQGGRSLDEPLGTLTTRDRHAVIDGDRMRMLIVPEMKAAMTFPADYILPSDHKTATHMLGNGVAVRVMRWLVARIRERA